MRQQVVFHSDTQHPRQGDCFAVDGRAGGTLGLPVLLVLANAAPRDVDGPVESEELLQMRHPRLRGALDRPISLERVIVQVACREIIEREPFRLGPDIPSVPEFLDTLLQQPDGVALARRLGTLPQLSTMGVEGDPPDSPTPEDAPHAAEVLLRRHRR